MLIAGQTWHSSLQPADSPAAVEAELGGRGISTHGQVTTGPTVFLNERRRIVRGIR